MLDFHKAQVKAPADEVHIESGRAGREVNILRIENPGAKRQFNEPWHSLPGTIIVIQYVDIGTLCRANKLCDTISLTVIEATSRRGCRRP